ncbi:hypothetical protein LOC51_10380 [Rubrivivax sp. JA1024]|uniref:hypothetical protein n=1 Tax=Rubrivivax sp. JA1026 TaxID=2710888 RepID=UPI001E350FA5|nr:hypothetical protein [Rubrivivax sp. JA1026]MCD0417618.1 hypothetical protein [Rubrivivax sp. JA1024]
MARRHAAAEQPMCALRVTDPFDPEPAAPPVPQLAWPRRHAAPPAAEHGDADTGRRPAAERSWRRHAHPGVPRG